MTLRPFIAAFALLATSVAYAATPTAPPAASDTMPTSVATAQRPPPAPRKPERTRPANPLNPRVIEAPGAALMMIPASYDALPIGPFSRF